MIQRGSLLQDDDKAVIWDKWNWVVGDKVNGFGDGVSVADVYGLEIVNLTCTGIPSYLKAQLKFSDDGELYFDNRNNIQLAQPVTLTIKVGVKHTWGTEPAEFTVTLYNEK